MHDDTMITPLPRYPFKWQGQPRKGFSFFCFVFGQGVFVLLWVICMYKHTDTCFIYWGFGVFSCAQ